MNNGQDIQEEDSNQLIFPKGFEDAKPIFNDQALLFLNQRKNNPDQSILGDFHKVYTKSYDYANTFQHFSPEIVGYVRSIFDHDTEKKLHPYEIALIANLCPQSVKETIALIPSLKEKFKDSEEDLETIIDRLQQYLKENF